MRALTRLDRRHGGRAALVAVALVGALAPGLSGRTACPQEGPAASAAPYSAAVREVLALRRSGEIDAERARERLVGMGPGVLPTLVEAVVRPGGLVDEEGPLLDAAGRQLLLDALPTWSAEQVVEATQALLATLEGLEEQERLDAQGWGIEIVGRVGDAQDLGALLDLIDAVDPTLRQHSFVSSRIRAALTGLLRRHQDVHVGLVARLPEMDPALLLVVARAVGEAGHGAGLVVLERLLGRSPQVDLEVLQAVGRLQVTDAEGLEGGCARVLRGNLESNDPQARRQAALGLARHGGAIDFAYVLGLLEDEDPRVSRAARWTLQQLAGRDLATSEAWRAWYDQETEWFRVEGRRLLLSTRAGLPEGAFRALRELSAHPLLRRELAAELADLPRHPELAVALAACDALARLGGPAAVEPLRAACADPRPAVQKAATGALAAVLAALERAPSGAAWGSL